MVYRSGRSGCGIFVAAFEFPDFCFVIGNSDKRGKLECGLGVVDRAEGGVEAVGKNDDTDSQEEGEPENHGESAGALGLRWAAGNHGLFHQSIRRLLDGNCHGGLLHALDDGLVECAVALDIALEDIEGDGDFIEFQRGGLLLFEGCAEFGLGLDGGFVLSIQNVAGLADIFM